MSLQIILADDHPIVRQGFKAILEREGFEVVGEAADGHEAARLAQTLRPDVAVLDLIMPGLNGLDAARAVSQASPRTKTILLTVHQEDQYVLGALQVGVKGYVLKTQAITEVVQAIQQVARGGLYLSPAVAEAVVRAYLGKAELPLDLLTPREREVVQLIAEGKTTKGIAEVLGISVKTVESHRANIMEKLDIHDIAGIVRYAIRRGLIQP
jgi:DNA-binding NarL/FixJ family response regulator